MEISTSVTDALRNIHTILGSLLDLVRSCFQVSCLLLAKLCCAVVPTCLHFTFWANSHQTTASIFTDFLETEQYNSNIWTATFTQFNRHVLLSHSKQVRNPHGTNGQARPTGEVLMVVMMMIFRPWNHSNDQYKLWISPVTASALSSVVLVWDVDCVYLLVKIFVCFYSRPILWLGFISLYFVCIQGSVQYF